MRWRIIGYIGLVLLVMGLVGWLFISLRPTASAGLLELTNLPDHYCPTTATVVITNLSPQKPAIMFDQNVPVSACRQISLQPIAGLGQTRFMTVKLAHALAFRLQIESPDDQYSFSPILGDVDNDNIINGIDEQLIVTSLLTTDKTARQNNDLDQDGQVTILDLSLTRINRQNGVDRPDGQSWTQG